MTFEGWRPISLGTEFWAYMDPPLPSWGDPTAREVAELLLFRSLVGTTTSDVQARHVQFSGGGHGGSPVPH